MSRQTNSDPVRISRRRRVVVCGVVCAAFVLAGGWLALQRWRGEPAVASDGAIDVPLGVEEAVIIRYGGPQLVPRPYRRGASVTLRIARQEEKDGVRIYDVRYVVNLPGEFNLTDYVTSRDGRAIDQLPAFRVRGVTRLTKDIDTRIHEIEEVEIGIWHWYYESLAALGVLWIGWLMGLVFVGRGRRRMVPERAVAQPPTLEEQIVIYLERLQASGLNVEEKAELEVLLLTHWKDRLSDDSRLAELCQRLRRDTRFGEAYAALQQWLHAPDAAVDSTQVAELCWPDSRSGAEAKP